MLRPSDCHFEVAPITTATCLPFVLLLRLSLIGLLLPLVCVFGFAVSSRIGNLSHIVRNLVQACDAGQPARFQPHQAQSASPITSSRSRPCSHGSSSVNIVTHWRQEHGILVMSVPQNIRCGPNAS